MTTLQQGGLPQYDGQSRRHEPSRRCGVCSQEAPAAAAYCPWCGSATPPAAPDGSPIAAPVHQAPPSGRRRTALIATGAVTALIAASASALWLLMPNSAERQLGQSAEALSASLTDLADARTPADVREAGGDAEAAAAAAEQFLSEADDAPVELVAVSSALAAIAALESVSGEAPAAWEAAEPELSDVAGLDVPGVDDALIIQASDNAGEIIDEAAAAYEAWRAANEAAVAARDAAITEATAHRADMQALIDDYAQLRNELSDYIEIVDTEGSTMSEAYYQFGEAASGRREIRDQMQSLSVPAGVSNEHGRLVGVISDGVDGIEAALRGLDQAYCGVYGCYVEDEPAYQAFRSESKRITVAFDDAIAQWQAAADRAIADAEAMPLPPMPEI